VIELARVAGRMGGIHTSHMRNEAADVLKSVEETIAIGERGGLPTQVTHHKIIGKGNWGRSVETLRLIAEARARGVDVTIDQYPYTASSTGLAALLPQWSQEGGSGEIVKRLDDPPTRARIKAAVVENIKFDRGGGDPKNIYIARCRWDQSLEGKNLAEIAVSRGRSSSFEDAAEAALEIVGKGSASAIFHAINEDDLVRILKDPLTMIASDGGVEIPGRGVPHPRSYGTFARVLGVYVRENRALSLEEAVRKMTSLPALRMGLHDRGLLRPGMKADIVIFDAARVRDRATFADPHQYAEGVSFVIVNGSVVLDDGKMTEARPGRALLGTAARR
jgi:dihydroorotase/N-acyl-D-amino-acid deacylase